MDELEAVLPFFVDYLGCFPYGYGGARSGPDVMRLLLENGVNEDDFLPNGELIMLEDTLVLTDSSNRVILRNTDFFHGTQIQHAEGR